MKPVLQQNLYENKVYDIYIKTNLTLEGNALTWIWKIVDYFNKNRIIEVPVQGVNKKLKVISVNPYIKTTGKNKEYGFVLRGKVLENPIPAALLLSVLEALIPVAIAIIIYLSLDKIDEVIETGSKGVSDVIGQIPKLNITIILVGAIFLIYVYLKG